MSDFEYQLLRHTSPTLAGIKVSNLFSFPKEQLLQYRQEIQYYNTQMRERDLCIDYIYSCSGRIFVLVYRKKMLKDILSQPKTASFLLSEGYPDPRSTDLARILNHLRRRTNHCHEFPHEIGFFLGYPADDVFEFISQKGKNYKLCGYWKVYFNEQSARKTFLAYNQSRELLLEKAKSGNPISSLIAK